ncbi:hypothetical protein [Anaerorhabdus sp.]
MYKLANDTKLSRRTTQRYLKELEKRDIFLEYLK